MAAVDDASACPNGASRDRLSFTTSLQAALSAADFVQENGPERPDFKVKLFADMDAATPVDSIIASSSSGITPSVMQSQCAHPERVLVGHPFNPPHVIPLVEVVGGAKTSAEAVRRAMAFYASIGKKAIRLNKELPGHVANRLQSALYREVLYLIEQGVLSVEDADDAVSYGPGLRWGVMGPSLQWHLGGGQGGIKHFMEHLLPAMVQGVEGSRHAERDAGAAANVADGVCARPPAARWSSWRRRRTRPWSDCFVCAPSTSCGRSRCDIAMIHAHALERGSREYGDRTACVSGDAPVDVSSTARTGWRDRRSPACTWAWPWRSPGPAAPERD